MPAVRCLQVGWTAHGFSRARASLCAFACSYPIDHIDKWHKPQRASHPKNVIFLTCDAFGVRRSMHALSNS